MSDKRRRAIRALAAETGLSYTAAAAENDRRRSFPCLDPSHPRLADGGIPTLAGCEALARREPHSGHTSQWLNQIREDHAREQQIPHTVAQAQPAMAAAAALNNG